MAEWHENLEALLRDRKMSEVSRQLGWRENRLAQMMGREQVPSAVEAVKLCAYLGASVEQVFGGSAMRELCEADAPFRLPSDRRQVAERVLAETIEKRDQRRAEKADRKRGSGRQTG